MLHDPHERRDEEEGSAQRDDVGEGRKGGTVVEAGELVGKERDAERGEQEGSGRRQQIAQGKRHRGPLDAHHGSSRQIVMRNSPGPSSSVSCLKPRSSS